ncbi:MAG: DUF2156 domain-containing protein [Promethearchaeota archaeon]
MDLDIAKAIEITDKPLFDKYFKKYSPAISELTFTNLYIWRKHYSFLFFEWNEHLLVFSKDFLKSKWAKPITDGKNIIYFLPPIGESPYNLIIELMKELNAIEFHKVPINIIQKLMVNHEFESLGAEILEDRPNWDYVYNIDELINLTGNKYRQNRRWLNKFLQNYEYEFKVITEGNIPLVKELQIEWCIIRGCEDEETLMEEQIAINEAFYNFRTLGFTGAYVCVNGKCVAYTFGEMLNENTLVIHIEKAHNGFEGSYQVINYLFLKNCFPNIKFVNREQDLGIYGLRRAKESYKPVRMEKKYIIYGS